MIDLDVWIKIKGFHATHYFKKSEIIHFVWAKENHIASGEILEGMQIRLRHSSGITILGPKSLEKQMLEQLADD